MLAKGETFGVSPGSVSGSALLSRQTGSVPVIYDELCHFL